MKLKKEFKFFTIFDYEKEQDYLTSMHKDGFKLVRVSGIGVYRFEKCEAEDMVYRLDYNAEGLKNKEEYVKMFADCGWEYLFDYAGYSYFRKAVTDEDSSPEIFCDEESRMQMMERVIKGRMIPLLVLFGAVLLPQFILNLTVYKNYAISSLYGVLLILYILIFSFGTKKYLNYKGRTK